MERLSWRVTCPNHASFRLLTIARKGSCGPTRELILYRTQSLVLCSEQMWKRFLKHFVSKAWILLLESASRVHTEDTDTATRYGSVQLSLRRRLWCSLYGEVIDRNVMSSPSVFSVALQIPRSCVVWDSVLPSHCEEQRVSSRYVESSDITEYMV